MTRSTGFVSLRRVLPAALTIALLASACGAKPWPTAAGAVGPVSPKVLLDAVRTTTAAQTARFSLSATVSGIPENGGGVESGGFSFDGVTDFATGNQQITMHFTGAVAKSVYSGGLQVRVVGGDMYIQIPKQVVPGGVKVPGGGNWWQSPTDNGVASDKVPGLDQSNPATFLAYLQAIYKGYRAVGSSTIRGVKTTHYVGVLDIDKALARPGLSPALRAKLRKGLQTPSGTIPPIPVETWVDGSGLLRRTSMRISVAGLFGFTAPGAAVPTAAFTVDLYDFGVAVNVHAPPASKVTPCCDVPTPATAS